MCVIITSHLHIIPPTLHTLPTPYTPHPYLILPYLISSDLILSYLILSYLTLPYLTLSCLHSYTTQHLSEEMVHQIIGEAVEVEKAFICDALPVSLIGMNSDLMREYIEYCADRLVTVML